MVDRANLDIIERIRPPIRSQSIGISQLSRRQSSVLNQKVANVGIWSKRVIATESTATQSSSQWCTPNPSTSSSGSSPQKIDDSHLRSVIDSQSRRISTLCGRIRQLQQEVHHERLRSSSWRIECERATKLSQQAQKATQSLYAAWQDTHSSVFVEELKYGLGLTDLQLTGVRNLLSMEFDETKNRYVRRRVSLSESGSNITESIFIPPIPNLTWLRRRATMVGEHLNLRDCIDARGSFVNAKMALLYSCKEAGKMRNGRYQVQILGDGHRAMRTYGIVNICARGLHGGAYFNSVATMNRW